MFDTGAHVQNASPDRKNADTTSGGIGQWEDCTSATAPVTRGPFDVWHSEEYLLGWLVKTHGWRVVEPGLLQRYRPDRSPCSVEAA